MKATYFDNAWIQHAIENLDIQLWYDEYFYDDEWFYHDENVKIDVMQHRNYEFLHELWIDYGFLNETYEKWDYYYEDYIEEQKKFKKICKENRVFWLDFFEHSMISFSLSMFRKNIGYYEMDRTRNVWYIAIKRRRWLTYEKAVKIAKNTIEDYNNYCNWFISEFRIEDENWEMIDACTWYYRDEDAKNDCIASIEYYLKNKNIEFSKVEID